MAEKVFEHEEEARVAIDTIVEPEIIELDLLGKKIKVRKQISFGEMLNMVENCVEGSFGLDGEYYPELTNFYIMKEIIETYTNAYLGTDPALVYSLLYNTNIFHEVVEIIDAYQLDDIRHSIERKICHLLRTNEKSLNKEFENMKASFESFGENFENMFKDINLDKISNILSTVFDAKNEGEKTDTEDSDT